MSVVPADGIAPFEASEWDFYGYGTLLTMFGIDTRSINWI